METSCLTVLLKRRSWRDWRPILAIAALCTFAGPAGLPWAAPTQTPWQTNAYGTLSTNRTYKYAMGYHFTPLVNGQVTGVGGYFNGTKTVRLFNKATGALLATATVSAANTWAYAAIAPVDVTAGTTYTVAVYLAGSGASRRRSLSPALPRTFGDIRIERSTYAYTGSNPTARPTNAITTTMYGQADIQFVPATTDTIPPNGTISINNNATYTTTTAVTLTLSATDNAGTVSQMQFSNDNITYSAPEAYATTKAWTLATGDGTKTVYAKFKDPAGNWSSPVNDTVVLDTTAPSAVVVTDDGVTTTSATSLHAMWTASSDPESGISEYQYQILQDAVYGPIIVNWTSTGTTASVTQTGLSLLQGKTYYIGVQVKNGAGLFSSTSYSDGITVQTATTSSAQTPWQTNAYGTLSTNRTYKYAMGYHFTPLVNGQVTGVGGYFNGTKTVRLFNKATGALLATATVSAANTWAYAAIAPVDVTAGTTYTVAVYLAGSGASRRRSLSPALPRTFGDIRIERSTYAYTRSNPTARPTNAITTTMYGQADIQFVPAASDTTAPTIPGQPTEDSPDQDYDADGTYTVFWTAASDPESGIAAYELQERVGTTGTWTTLSSTIAGTATSFPVSGRAHNTAYDYQLRAQNGAGLWGTWSPISDGILVDTTAPDAVSVTDDGAATTSTTQLHAVWTSSSDPESGVVDYQYLIRQDSTTGTILVDWTSLGLATQVTRTGLTLLVGKTYYIGVRAKNGAALYSAANDSDGITVVLNDTTPPTGSVTINGNAALTTTQAVTLTLTATDDQGVVSFMRFSHDGISFTEPEPFAATKSWQLGPGDGSKTVYAAFQDPTGNWSTPTSDAILLDTSPPSGSIVVNGDASTTTTQAVTVTCNVQDAGSGMGSGARMQFSNDGLSWSAPEAYQTSKAWTLPSGTGTKRVFAKFADAAGNWMAQAVSDSILLDASGGTELSIFSFKVTQIGPTQATVSWSTTLPSDSQVEYGPTSALGSTTPLDATLVTSHAQTLTGLSPANRYYVRAHSQTATGQSAFSSTLTFTTFSQWSSAPVIPSFIGQSLLMDIDHDGDLDLAVMVPEGQGQSRLFRNDSGSFVDVTAQAGDLAGVNGSKFIDGSADFYDVSDMDLDADGDLDLVVGREGFNRLLRNDGTGHFTEVTEQAGADQGSYSRTVVPLDANLDGLVDVYFGNDFWPRQDFLLVNLGKGFFEDQAIRAGIAEAAGALDVAAGDYDRDGDSDVFIANFEGPMVYRNNGDGTFTNVTAQTGLVGSYATGIALGDYDNDGDLDVDMTHDFYGSGVRNRLYRNNGDGTFTDVSAPAGVAGLWGRDVTWLDLDNDGWLDLVLESSAYRNNQDGTFSLAGSVFGGGFGDYDNDGDLDTASLQNNSPPNHWLKLHLRGLTNRFGIGAQVTVIAGALLQVREVGMGNGNVEVALPLVIGMGPYTQADLITIRWPSGTIQSFSNVAVDQVLTLTEPNDTRTPLIMAIQAGNVAPTQAIVSWVTDEAASSQIEFGPTTAYGSLTTLEPAPVRFHKHLIGGLSPSTLYHYRVRSVDGAGNLAVSQDQVFTTPAPAPARTDDQLLDETQANATRYFYEQALANGLVKDRSDTSFASVGATGYGLLAMCALADRAGSNANWTITAAQARARAELILDTLLELQNRQSEVPYGNEAGIAGFFYRYLDSQGMRQFIYEVSTVDTAYAIAGALAAGEYFGGSLKTKAELLFKQAKWDFFLNTNLLSERYLQYSMGWQSGNQPMGATWDRPSDETLLVSLLALAQDPSNAQRQQAYYRWPRVSRSYAGYTVVNSFFGSLFTYYMAHAFVDFQSLGPDVPSRLGSSAMAVDWFDNAKQAALANRAFAINHSFRYLSYGDNAWGLSSCQRADDSGYFGENGARPKEEIAAYFNGTLPPAAAISTMPILRTSSTEVLKDNLAFKALRYYYDTYYANLWGPYGPKASFNDQGQFSQLYLGIDVGPMAALMENYRSGLLWRAFMKNRHVIASLQQISTTPPTPPAIPPTPSVTSLVPSATTNPTLTLSGTKGANTSIWINGVEVVARDTSTTWSDTLTLTEGANFLGILSKDASGIESGALAFLVWLDTRPPAAPTLTNPPTMTGANSVGLLGTKEAYSAIWINGQKLVPITSETTWFVEVPLTEGSNTLSIFSSDRAGNVSASISHTIYYDRTPPTTPVVTDDGQYTTQLGQLHFRWSSQDPETGIVKYIYTLYRQSPSGAVSVLLSPRETTLTDLTITGLLLLVGESYFVEVRVFNGAGVLSDIGRSDGITATIISSCSPADGATFTGGQTIAMSAFTSSATPLYQFAVDGVIKRPWSSSSSFSWLTSSADVHRHTISCQVQAGGTQDERRQDIYIFREGFGPPAHP